VLCDKTCIANVVSEVETVKLPGIKRNEVEHRARI
jgi:hypothetical protein